MDTQQQSFQQCLQNVKDITRLVSCRVLSKFWLSNNRNVIKLVLVEKLFHNGVETMPVRIS